MQRQTAATCLFQNDTVIGYLRQNDDFTSENTVIEEIDGIFTELQEWRGEMPAPQQIAEATASGNKSQQEIDFMLHRYDQMQEDYDRAGGYTYKGEIRGVLSSHGVCRGYIQQKNRHAFGR